MSGVRFWYIFPMSRWHFWYIFSDANAVIITIALKRGGYDNVTVTCYYQA